MQATHLFGARDCCSARNDCARRATWQAFSGSRRGRPCLGRHGCCVNAVVGSPALWQPQVRPAPARHATRLEGEALGRRVGERLQAKQAASPRGICIDSYVFCSIHHHAPQGRWAGCPFVGPIRGCHRAGAHATTLTQQPMQPQKRRPRAWAREGIPGPPTPPNQQRTECLQCLP